MKKECLDFLIDKTILISCHSVLQTAILSLNLLYSLSQTCISSPNTLPQSSTFYAVSVSLLIYEWYYSRPVLQYWEAELPLPSGGETAY